MTGSPFFRWSCVVAFALTTIALPASGQETEATDDAEDAAAARGTVPRRVTVDEAFGGPDPEPGGYAVRLLTQVRHTQTAASSSDTLRQRIADDVTSPSQAEFIENAALNRAARGDGLMLNRAFVRVVAQPTEVASGKIILDLADLMYGRPRRSVKQAYGRLRLEKRYSVRTGLFKIPFSLLELLPAATYELAEQGPTGEMLRDIGFAGRDIGAMFDFAPLEKKRWLRGYLGVFSGEKLGPQLESGPGILAGRLTTSPIKALRVGANLVWRFHEVQQTERPEFNLYDRGLALGVDATIAKKGFELRAEWLSGDRTEYSRQIPARGLDLPRTASRFMAAWAVASYRIRLAPDLALVPALRAEWVDYDRTLPVGEVSYFSGALNLDFLAHARLLFDLSYRTARPGTTELAPGTRLYIADATTGIVQLQFVL